MTTTPSGQIWLATENGVRYSLDGGETWNAGDRALFDRSNAVTVAVGLNEHGGERIAIALTDRVYTTDDAGQTFEPFFTGITRRTINQIAVGPARENEPSHWWVAAGAELWTTAPAGRDSTVLDPMSSTARWARVRLAHTPPMNVVIDTALDRLRLNPRQVSDTITAGQASWLLPYLSVQAIGFNGAYVNLANNMAPMGLIQTFNNWNQIEWTLFVRATWSLQGRYVSPPNRSALYTLRQTIGFAVEDAWHERVLLLARLAGGEQDPTRVAVVRERIGVLEAALQAWTGRPTDQRVYER
jgi:hypothetical protein